MVIEVSPVHLSKAAMSIVLTLEICKMIVLPFMAKLAVGVFIGTIVPNILSLLTLYRHPCLTESFAFVKKVLAK